MTRRSALTPKPAPRWDAGGGAIVREIRFSGPALEELRSICSDPEFVASLEAAASVYSSRLDDAEIPPADMRATLADLEAKTNALAELLDTLPAHPLGIEIEVAWNDQTSTLPATAWGELRDGLRQLQHMIGVADAHFPERRNAGALTVPAVSKCS
jgi:hypothetical protein